ncbi:ABC transporter permease [Meiothermus taiwanensis]|uniref:Uncharacterized protein n=2 Tax=Meiothermus taiwanensis TaxID=172827 RepID=A0A399DZL0_9DEIN|nr:ABC transporter permease [Meiothermus taiwanensis]KZK15042.1 hypothetical protein A3962_02890 [Meiothermus taiwanensis]RIH76808.1 hypothetical protein Mcate_01616 [Meiothermus taiwanensis]
MKPFTTLLWLDSRKFTGIGLMLLVLGVAWFFVARQIFVWNGANPGSALAVVATTLLMASGVSVALLIVLALDFAREYRAGRWALLLGSPQPAWLYLAAKAVFGGAVLTLFNGAMWFIQSFWLAQAGVGLPFSLWASLWLYQLGGLALVVPALFLGFWVAAYIPGRATLLALVVGLLGMGQVLEWSLRLFGDQFYKLLPAWKLPAPNVAQSPGVRMQWEAFPGLPSEGFVILLFLSLLFFVLASRLWQEVEA